MITISSLTFRKICLLYKKPVNSPSNFEKAETMIPLNDKNTGNTGNQNDRNTVNTGNQNTGNERSQVNFGIRFYVSMDTLINIITVLFLLIINDLN